MMCGEIDEAEAKLRITRRAAAKARGQAATINPKGGRPKKGKTRAGGLGFEGQGSNSEEKLLRRITRKSETDPAAREALASYEAGQLGSVAEAARAAGIKGPAPKRIILGDPAAHAAAIRDMGDDYVRAVIAALTGEPRRNG
jgi:hypothetical protein